VGEGSAVGPIPITNQVARGLIPGECLCDLACNPFRGRMWCDVDPDKFSALQSNDDKDIEQALLARSRAASLGSLFLLS
jgi:hypothetical protein